MRKKNQELWFIQKEGHLHFLECKFLLGKSELATYIPEYHDLYNENIEDMVYIERILKDNLMRINSLEDHAN